MDYNLALEKAVLEYAKSIGARPSRTVVSRAQIPGYMDDHVSAMATQLGEQGLIISSSLKDGPGVGVSNINESGSNRLKEIVSAEEKVAEADRVKVQASAERALQKKWWRRLIKRGNVAVQN